MATGRFDKFGPSRAVKSMKSKNGHEMVKETSPRPLDTILHKKTATIIMAPTVLRVTDFNISNFSWSEPEIINKMNLIIIIIIARLTITWGMQTWEAGHSRRTDSADAPAAWTRGLPAVLIQVYK